MLTLDQLNSLVSQHLNMNAELEIEFHGNVCFITDNKRFIEIDNNGKITDSGIYISH